MVVTVTFLWKPEAPVSKAIMTQEFVNISRKIIHNYASNPQGIPLLLLFTTFRPSLTKSSIYENTLRNWAQLRPAVQPLMFYDKSLPAHWKELLKKLGWALLPVPKYNSHDLPILRYMFETATDSFPALHYGYSNGDILYDESLVLTLESLYRHPVVEDFLMVGRRINYNFATNELTHSFTDVRKYTIKDSARIFIKDAQDYFITTKHAFVWDDLPNFVIGRVGYDNWLVSYAMTNGPLLIDATNTVLCLHQTGSDGDYSGGHADKVVRNYNLDLVKPGFKYNLGSTDCAHWVTLFNDKLKSVVIRKRPPKFCYGHQYTYFEHQDVEIPQE